MADFGFAFDANEVEPSAPFVPLPPGEYVMQIIAGAMEPTANGDGRFLKLELEITDGEHAGRKTLDRLNLENPNPQAVEIAKRTLSAIGHAVGVLQFSSTAPLEFKKMLVKVATVPRKDKNKQVVPGEFSNEIKGYKPVNRTAASSGGTPSTQQKSGFTPSTAGSGSTGGGGGGAPWKRQS